MNEIQTIWDELVPEEEIPYGFLIDSMEKAEWAMTKIARAEARIQDRRAVAAAIKDQINARLEVICKADLQTVENMTTMIRPWAELEIAKAGKRKSLPLLGGEVGFRQSPARLEITDEATTLAWLKANGRQSHIRVKEEIDKNAVKQAIKETGEIPQGVELVPGDIRFYVEAAPLKIEKKET